MTHFVSRLHTRTAKPQGFTLIELLVVIAIIAILAAILFPVFGRARENARRSSCLSNIKQISLGILQYTQDYDETFPMLNVQNVTGTAGPPYSRARGWADAIYPYTKSVQVYQCPSETQPGTDNANAGLGSAAQFTDYAYNALIGSPGNGGTVFGAPAKKLSALSAPVLTVMVNDSVGAGAGNNAGVGCGFNVAYTNAALCGPNGMGTLAVIPDKQTTSATESITQARHLEGHNFGFADGHAKWFKGQTGAGAMTKVGPTGPSANTYVLQIRSTRVWTAKHGTKFGDATFAINEEGTQQ